MPRKFLATRLPSWFPIAVFLALPSAVLAGCGSDKEGGGDKGNGGSGGSADGGNVSATGGEETSTGGAATGGASGGTDATGGSKATQGGSGGSETGGKASGGASTGGDVTTTGGASGKGTGGASSKGGQASSGGSGSGGKAATGGTAGQASATGGSAGAAAPGVSPCDPQVAFFCDDFEKGTAGKTPASPWAGDSEITVSTTRAWSGSKSIAVSQGSATLDFNLSPTRDVLFVRMMLWTSFVGQSEDSRVGLVSVTSGTHTAATDANLNLLSFHYFGSDEAAIESTTKIPVMSWVCLEMSYDRSTRIFRAWANGKEATELGSPVAGSAIPGPWTKVSLRNEIFHGGTGTLFLDDVAFGTGRIGCPTVP